MSTLATTCAPGRAVDLIARIAAALDIEPTRVLATDA
jgi:hypothetical protein